MLYDTYMAFKNRFDVQNSWESSSQKQQIV